MGNAGPKHSGDGTPPPGRLPAEWVEQVGSRLVTTLDGLAEGFQIIDRDWRYVYLNEAAARHGRRPREELVGRTMMEAYPGIDQTEVFGHLGRVMAERVPHRMENTFTYPDGDTATFELRIEPCPEGITVLSVDVSERKELEARLRQAEKMDALGRLAGGVAHDLNNLLTVVTGLGSLLAEEIPSAHPGRASLDDLLDVVGRATRLGRQLLSFAGGSAAEPKTIDLDRQVADAEPMLRQVLGRDHSLEIHRAGAPAPARIDPTALDRILSNLAKNARDAMEPGGRLSIEVGQTTLAADQELRHGNTIPAGDYVLLTVSDDGAGIAPDVQERRFEPFFTTKALGRGTGLGLATSWGLVRQAGGGIWVYSETGHGTTFKIYLPRAGTPAEAGPADPPTRPRRSGSGGATILVVDDDDDLRPLTCRILSRSGYTVLDAPGAADALTLAAAHDGPIHLLLSDIVMPDRSGPDLATDLAARRPATRLLLMSGYGGQAAAHHRLPETNAPVLAKPFTPAELLHAVGEALGEDEPPGEPADGPR